MAGRLLIAIDFDDTFTADPPLWRRFIDSAVLSGHKVICVSARDDTESQRMQLRSALPDGVSDILLSYDKAKRNFAKSKWYSVDIWIDDCPDAIVTNFDGSSLCVQWRALSEQIQSLILSVHEAREQRDMADNKAMAKLQTEMGSLRAEITRLRAQLDPLRLIGAN